MFRVSVFCVIICNHEKPLKYIKEMMILVKASKIKHQYYVGASKMIVSWATYATRQPLCISVAFTLRMSLLSKLLFKWKWHSASLTITTFIGPETSNLAFNKSRL